MSSRLRLVVLGMMGRCPFGGQTWLYLNWLYGLQKLGHDVWYVEDDSVWPYDPIKSTITNDCSYAVKHIAGCMEKIGMPDKWAYRLPDANRKCWGMTELELNDLYRSCDALLNIVGATDLRDEQLASAFRVYIETDPVTAELRLANGDEHTRIAFGNHDVIATYGENYGACDSGVPLNGLDQKYRKTRQPIALEFWPMVYDSSAKYFTTIGNYRQNGNDVEYNGNVYYWSKHHEWNKYLNLPRLTQQQFELAMLPDDLKDQALLKNYGWTLVSPLEMSLDIFGAYPAYFRRSRGEFTVAKDQNVRLRSGWFSERDACYLASGKPVITQDTGFSNIIPVGEGLFVFTSTEEALTAIDKINSDYRRHCEAARAIAEEYFESVSVALRLLKDLGLN